MHAHDSCQSWSFGPISFFQAQAHSLKRCFNLNAVLLNDERKTQRGRRDLEMPTELHGANLASFWLQRIGAGDSVEAGWADDIDGTLEYDSE
uniref:Uncharacterized protein n=1 Tax=Kalanchoe fedtschenkoi TaxID=63787 RepID=A0A7N0UE19_KALFE